VVLISKKNISILEGEKEPELVFCGSFKTSMNGFLQNKPAEKLYTTKFK
jgi:hypothetical protein